MAERKPLLVELGTEELPPHALDELAAAFRRGLCDGLTKAGISAGFDAARAYATPRRLAVYIPDVALMQPAQTLERRGPALAAALGADGQPSRALLGFARDWNRLAASLNYARIARMLHLAAALFAAGAIASLYLRGIVSEYRVGWESTFLGANAVHGLLSAVFWPVVHLLGMQPFSVDQVAALQFSQPPQPASGARWVHLYAALLALIVVLPRAVLAALAWRRERQLVRTFPLDLQEPYFQRLLAGAGGAVGGGAGPRAGATHAGALSVWPYSFRLNDARRQGLQEVWADHPVDVMLYWQHWAREPLAAQRLTQVVKQAARERLLQA